MNRPSKYFVMAGALTTFMVTTSLWTAPKLLAQVRAALVQNVDEPGRNPLTLHQNFTSGSWTVPAGQRWVIEQASARCELTARFLYGFSVSVYKPVGPLGFSQVSFARVATYYERTISTLNYWVGTGPTLLYANSGETVSPSAADSASFAVDQKCAFSVIGHSINLP